MATLIDEDDDDDDMSLMVWCQIKGDLLMKKRWGSIALDVDDWFMFFCSVWGVHKRHLFLEELFCHALYQVLCHKGNTTSNNSFELHLKFLCSGGIAQIWRFLFNDYGDLALRNTSPSCRDFPSTKRGNFKRGLNQSRFLHCPLFRPGESYSGVMKSAYTCGQ